MGIINCILLFSNSSHRTSMVLSMRICARRRGSVQTHRRWEHDGELPVASAHPLDQSRVRHSASTHVYTECLGQTLGILPPSRKDCSFREIQDMLVVMKNDLIAPNLSCIAT
jgi:hypothetical protein